MKSVIEKGLIGLANAGVINGGNWFAGHFGAEVLSLAFLLIDTRVDKQAEPLVQSRIETCLKRHAQYFETALPEENEANSLSIEDLCCAIEKSISELCVDGHHTIYSALALRAFSLFPELARPEVIRGLVSLLAVCQKAGFDRYYGLDTSALTQKKYIEKFTFVSAVHAAEVSLDQHKQVITDRDVDGEFYFLSGSRLHLITHAQALLELEQMGYVNIVKAGLHGFQKHCICIDASAVPNDAHAYYAKQKLDPRQDSFWRRKKDNPHHAKLAYAVLSIFSALPNAKVEVLKNVSTYWEFYE